MALHDTHTTLAVPKSRREALLMVIQDAYKADATLVNRRYLAGELSLTEWQAETRDLVKRAHINGFMAGYGANWSDVTQQMWGGIGARLKKQYGRLRRYASDVAGRGDAVTERYLNWRTGLYISAIRQQFAAGLAWSEDFPADALPALPADGTTRCLTNCKCRWEVKRKSAREWRAWWRLGRAEHCPTCLGRARDWKNLRIIRQDSGSGVLVTPIVPHFA